MSDHTPGTVRALAPTPILRDELLFSGLIVSTVHNPLPKVGGRPPHYETAVLRTSGGFPTFQRQTSTEADARALHARVLEALQSGVSPDDLSGVL